MSQYPHGGYGQHPVSYTPQYPYPYAYQAPGTYPPPVYGSPPTESRGADGHYVTTQNAFNQNASRIPGLGIVGTPNSGSPYNPAGVPAWNQNQTPSFSAGAPGSAPSVPSAPQPPVAPLAPRAFFTQEPRENFPSIQHPVPTSTRLPNPNELQKQSSDDMEEGELSEGQFEDLYEPREPASRSVNPVPPHKDASNTDLSRGASVVDTPDAGFYATEDEEGVTSRAGNHMDAGEFLSTSNHASQGPTNQGRDRSGSYSPYLSPREIQSDRTPNDGHLSPQAHQIPQATTTTKVNEYTQAVPGLQHATSRASKSYAANDAPSPVPHPMQGLMENQWTFKSLDEAKKEAQKAILRLWPLGVKYQHYLDEGFDEKVIKSLFDALHLDISTGRPKEPEPPQAPAQDLGLKMHDQAALSSKSPSADAQPPAQQTKAMDKSEERKDRIARLLAAKAGKAAPTQTNPPMATTPGGPSASALRTREDKELLLQQKMEALRKSREARAQKVTSDNIKDTSSVVPNGNETSVSAIPQPVSNLVASPEPESTSISAVSSAYPTKDASPEETPQEPASILTLFSSTPQLIEPTSQRKRPVAMDFVDYPSMAGTLKRPFGQGRKDSSLVIDVSDGSDEEMDIDMDEDSPIEPSNIQRADSSARPGPSMRDFPPLTDTSQRQYSSPGPSVNTPPTGPSNGRRRETELDRKEKAIQEMRRKIAEAEAKRKAKIVSGGSQTPNPAALTPPDPKDDETSRPPVSRVSSMGDAPVSDGPSAQLLAEAVSATLPKLSEIRHKDGLRAERRGRISSLDLPRVDGTLNEKMNRLKLLKEEQAKLQAEIEASLAEKNKLADELNELDEETPVHSPQEDGQLVEDSPDAAGAALPVSDTDSPAKTSTSPSEGAAPVGDSPPLEDVIPRLAPVTQDQSEALADATKVLRQDPQPSSKHNEPSNEATSSDADAVPGPSPQLSAPDQEPVTSGSFAPSEGGQLADESTNLDAAMDEPGPVEVPQEENETTSDAYEPPEPIEHDTADHMTVASSPFSPAPAANSSTLQSIDHAPQDTTESLPLPTQISIAAQPREAIQEMEDKISSSEVPTVLQPNLESTFSPYESPLQNFRAYRFHRDFRGTVAGGLKSLTFSNRIDPNKALCPVDLSGQPCPQGDSCQFQHFESIAVPDDQILLELGKADDYTGEQKNRFIQGLRELLQNFRANKIRDFETIASGIIEFRSRFLGDESKILQLEGVAI